MSSRTKEKLIIVVAPTGETPSREGGPYVPSTPEEIAEEAYNCYNAGASIVHVHARDRKTKQHTSDITVFKEIVERIKEKCGILIQLTGAMGNIQDPVTKQWLAPTDEARMALLDLNPRPDMTCVPAGSSNYYGPSGKNTTLINTPDFLRKYFKAVSERKFKNEIEIWDSSYLYNALRLAEEGAFDKNGPVWFNLALVGVMVINPQHRGNSFIYQKKQKGCFQRQYWN